MVNCLISLYEWFYIYSPDIGEILIPTTSLYQMCLKCFTITFFWYIDEERDQGKTHVSWSLLCIPLRSFSVSLSILFLSPFLLQYTKFHNNSAESVLSALKISVLESPRVSPSSTEFSPQVKTFPVTILSALSNYNVYLLV